MDKMSQQLNRRPHHHHHHTGFRSNQDQLQRQDNLQPPNPMGLDQLSLFELREMAKRQQENIERQQRLIMAREEKLKYLKQQTSTHRVQEQEEKLFTLKESVSSQEMKLRHLKLLRGQVHHQKVTNSSSCAELESIRALFNEKEKELSVAVAKVDALTRQLEELRKGNTTNSYHIQTSTTGSHSENNAKFNLELEKLRQELLYRTKLTEQQKEELTHKKSLVSQRKSDLSHIDERISELQQRLAKKRLLNQQLSSQMQSHLIRANGAPTYPASGTLPGGLGTGNPVLRSSVGPGYGLKLAQNLRPLSANIAAVEPLQRQPPPANNGDPLEKDKHHTGGNPDFMYCKQDPKYQTLPYNTKFGSKQTQAKFSQGFNSSIEGNNKCNESENPFNRSVKSTENCASPAPASGAKTSGGDKHVMDERPSPSGSSSSDQPSLHLSPAKSAGATHQSSGHQLQHPLNYHYPITHRMQQLPDQQQHSGLPGDGDSKPSKAYSGRTAATVEITGQLTNGTKGSTHSYPLPAPLPPVPSQGSLGSVNGKGSKVNPPPLIMPPNSINKPLVPPKPSIPVKPVPPPRLTPSSSPTACSPTSGSPPDIDSVDNAISILKGNATFERKNLYANHCSPPSSASSHRYPSPQSQASQPQPQSHGLQRGYVSKSVQQFHESNQNTNIFKQGYRQKTYHSESGEKRDFNAPPNGEESADAESCGTSGRSDRELLSNGSKGVPVSSPSSSSSSSYPGHHSAETSDTKSIGGELNADVETKRISAPVSSSSCNISASTSTSASAIIASAANVDWHKVKRRPVIVDNDMEQELAAQITSALESPSQPAVEEGSLAADHRFLIQTSTSANSDVDALLPGLPLHEKANEPHVEREKKAIKQQATEGHETVEPYESLSSEGDSNLPEIGRTNHVKGHKEPPISECKQETGSIISVSGVRRTKGNLKNQKQTNEKGITRRVSFDPLALLLDAALEGELELVKKTATEVPNPSAANDEGITALHNAICAGHLDIVQFLVQMGCDVNAQDSDGWTPLHCAASCNNLTMVKFLVEHGACIFATTLSDHETAAEKCEEDEEGFDGCSQYLYSVQEKLGVLNGGALYAVYEYGAQNADELSFKDGDRLAILRKGDEQEREWWWAKLKDSEGYVPRNLFGLYPRVRLSKEQDNLNSNEESL